MAIKFFRNYRVSYREDRAIFPTLINFWPRFWFVVIALALLLLPLPLQQYWIYTINLGLIAVIGALGLNLLTGYSGQISIAHASFLALGAYTTAYLGRFGVPLYLAIPASGAVRYSFIRSVNPYIIPSICCAPSLPLRGNFKTKSLRSRLSSMPGRPAHSM